MAEQTRRLVLAGGAANGVVTRCRDFTRSALMDWQWPADAEETDDALLLVSELVTNACLHAGGPRELVLRHAPGLLRVEVRDDSPEPPRRRPTGDPGRPGGHGLVMLERLSAEWGFTTAAPDPAAPEAGHPGKTVWAAIRAPRG
ncbi:ATP-binding protein [Streptomyces sp. RerS4]|uniref:ATP-binding protein n=1 Tax=Streptomyces sp. RerS4 TaxID=2942449 RepID=UPI00201C231B|nr:ATP-binding protein [Streptomyces sp. RerS4]UQX01902.1 ATP-binding protein [Streptomyces sp. RerS4]